MKWIVLTLCLLMATPGRAQDTANTHKVLCVGDSLTFGEGGHGTTWPLVFSSLSKLETINQGQSGWIPRHLKYYFLLHDCDCLTLDQLKTVPPREMESRRFQPTINGLRQFIANGQTVIVQSGSSFLKYRWDANSHENGPDAVAPNPIESPAWPPVPPNGPNGRWLKVGDSPPPSVPDTAVFYVGANGMDVDDIAASLKEILACYLHRPGRHFVVLGLLNRQPYMAKPADIENWGGLIKTCNTYLAATYPDNFIDLQAWFTSQGRYAGGGFKTRDFVKDATDQAVANDEADKAKGIVPRSLRPAEAITHLDAAGYTAIGTLVYEFMRDKKWLAPDGGR